MKWLNEPRDWTHSGGVLTFTTEPKTDFWRKTHYGFIRDSGHFYGQPITGDFTAEVKVTGNYRTLYDQAGLMVRLDENNWLKCGVEFVDGEQLASVVLTREYSDWSFVPIPGNPASAWVRFRREGGAVEVHYSVDGTTFRQLRLGYLTSGTVEVGMMACSPGDEGFTVRFEGFKLEPIDASTEPD
jgi:regulation of enolase protein 1 (concanavalin A-like superfamily)